jgi:hypothetical protein
LKDAEKVQAEGRLINGLTTHGNLIQYFDVFVASSESGMCICVDMELCDGGDLGKVQKRMQEEGETIPEALLTNWFKQIYCGLGELHRLHITHRDIKPANIGLAGNPLCVKLIDFGFAVQVEGTFAEGNTKTMGGTQVYMAMEILSGHYGPPVDIWAAGITMAVMLVGEQPIGMLQQERRVDEFLMRIQCSSSESTDFFRQLIKKILQMDPSRRPSASEVIGFFEAGTLVAPVQTSQTPAGASNTGGGVVNPTTAGSVTSGPAMAAGPLALGLLTEKDRAWEKNTSSATCRICAAKFSITKRKHHCRTCGRRVCDACTQTKIEKQRHCDACIESVADSEQRISLQTGLTKARESVFSSEEGVARLAAIDQIINQVEQQGCTHNNGGTLRELKTDREAFLKAVKTCRVWEQQGTEIAELGQQARVPVQSSKEGFQRLAKLQAAVDAMTAKCAADNTSALTQLRKVVATLKESSKAKQEEEEEAKRQREAALVGARKSHPEACRFLPEVEQVLLYVACLAIPSQAKAAFEEYLRLQSLATASQKKYSEQLNKYNEQQSQLASFKKDMQAAQQRSDRGMVRELLASIKSIESSALSQPSGQPLESPTTSTVPRVTAVLALADSVKQQLDYKAVLAPLVSSLLKQDLPDVDGADWVDDVCSKELIRCVSDTNLQALKKETPEGKVEEVKKQRRAAAAAAVAAAETESKRRAVAMAK